MDGTASLQDPYGIPFGWYQIAWSEDVPVGGVAPRYYFGRDLVLWRGEDGVVHVQDAYCPHLAAHLGHGGAVDGCNLTCPLHGWAYNGQGDNVDVPYSDAPNAKAKLRSYPTVELDRFIYVWFHPMHVEPLWEPKLPPLATSDLRSDWRSEMFQIKAPLYEVALNSVDSPHFPAVHGITGELVGDALRLDGYDLYTEFNMGYPFEGIEIPGRVTIESWGIGMAVSTVSDPITAIFMIGLIPVTSRMVEVRLSVAVETVPEGTDEILAAAASNIHGQFADDIPVWEHKGWNHRPALSADDPPYTPFRKWYQQFVVPTDVEESPIVPAPHGDPFETNRIAVAPAVKRTPALTVTPA